MIILNAEGQTCNKFFTYINYISDSLETGAKIIILSPDPTTRDYPNLRKSGLLKYPFYYARIEKTIGYKNYIKLLNILFGNKYSLKLFSVLFNFIPLVKFINAPTGSYKSDNIGKYDVDLKQIFRPDHKITNQVESQFVKVRKNCEIIYGVHIRYGDYKTWQGGKYYYSLEQYHLVMLKVKELFPNQSVAFFISSNEKINLNSFVDCECFLVSNGSSTHDLFGLGICDYIIGPPSTFSGWASYYGNTPLYFIKNPNSEISLGSFKNSSEIWG